MVNKVILLGNLAADPERRSTPQGTVVVNIRLATNEKWRDRDGNMQERSEFHRIVFWGKQAETIDRYARKGNPLYVEGRIQTREYQDRDGNRRWATEIVARDFRFIGGARREEEKGGEARASLSGGGGWDAPPPAESQVPGSGAGNRGGGKADDAPGGEPFEGEWSGAGNDDDLPF